MTVLPQHNALGENGAPVELPESAKLIVHLILFGAFDPAAHYDVSVLQEERYSNLRPIGTSSEGIRFNLDGLLSFTTRGADAHPGYVQVFRNQLNDEPVQPRGHARFAAKATKCAVG